MLTHIWSVDLRKHRGPSAKCHLGKVRCDGHGNVYLADPVAKTIHKFDNRGHALRWRAGRGLLSVENLDEIAVDSEGTILVADSSHGRIAVFDSSGRLKRFIETPSNPLQVAVDGQGFVYVNAVTPDANLHKYAVNGKKILSFKTGAFLYPSEDLFSSGPLSIENHLEIEKAIGSLAVDPRNRLYFTSDCYYDIKVFDQSSRLIKSFRRSIRAKKVDLIVKGRAEVGWIRVISDLAIGTKPKRLYVLRGGSRAGRAIVDVWSWSGRLRGEILLDGPARSIACDSRGHLYALYSSITERVATLEKYLVN